MGKNKARTKYDKRSEKLLREGEGNKQEILNLVANYTNGKVRGGILPHKIAKEVKVSRQAVQSHLKSLVLERKVEKIKERGHRREYRVTDSYRVSKEWKALIMRPMAREMIDSIWLKPKMTDFALHREFYERMLPPQREFYEKMSRDNSTISTKYCQTKFSRAETAEKYVFEFVNRTAAFITYMFIESIKAINEKPDRDDTLAKVIIDKGIDLRGGIFSGFQLLCQFLKADPNEMSRALFNVYPGAGMLEKYWSDRIQLSKTFKESMNEKAKRDNS